MATVEQVFSIKRAESAPFGMHSSGGRTVHQQWTRRQRHRRLRDTRRGRQSFCRACSGYLGTPHTYGSATSVCCSWRRGKWPHSPTSKKPLSIPQLAYCAAWLGHEMQWRFSWSRQITPTRIRNLSVPDSFPVSVAYDAHAHLPVTSNTQPIGAWEPTWHSFRLGSLFDLEPGDYHSLSDLAPGGVPVVSCGIGNNGISGYFDVDASYRDRLTIAFAGMNALNAKYHPYGFAAKDDVAICNPKKPMQISTLLFIQAMLDRERWRYSYYRKCYMGKLKAVRSQATFS